MAVFSRNYVFLRHSFFDLISIYDSKGISDLNEQETKTLQEFASNVGSSVLERVLDRLQSLNTNSGRINSNSNQNQAAVGVNM